MSIETSVIKCKECGVTKVRTLAGYYPNRKDKRWVDDLGREFNGKLCSQCVVDKARERKANKKKNGYI